jgi:hypothetical protein
MSAQRAVPIDHGVDDNEILDADTSAAILRWMETATVPNGVSADQWEKWMAGGCKGRLRAHGKIVTTAMLGSWANSGALR